MLKRFHLIVPLTLFWALPCSADSAIHNIAGYTPTNDGIREFSVLVFDGSGHVIATGGDELLDGVPDDSRIDGDGGTVVPGLTDAHAHIYSLGFLTSSLDLTGTDSLEAAIGRIDDYAGQRTPDFRGCGDGRKQSIGQRQSNI